MFGIIAGDWKATPWEARELDGHGGWAEERFMVAWRKGGEDAARLDIARKKR